MKNISKRKKILVKKIYTARNEFEYVEMDTKEANAIMNTIIQGTKFDSYRIEKAKWPIVLKKKVSKFVRHNFVKIVWIILGAVIASFIRSRFFSS